MSNIHARPASAADLEAIWAHDLAANPDWLEWRDGSIRENHTGMAQTFVIFNGEAPIGCGTLLFSPDCDAIKGRAELADSATTANINALRLDKPYRGKGHMSALVKQMEDYARERGYTKLTIGVEVKDTVPLTIYQHWGYTQFVLGCHEDGEPQATLYFAKGL
ncbi:MAG: GNAT family N-acetyltransferase [Oscillospiraceae bacterium]|nr:GNAT family N-acetyltransferase [Oscillospiraceae bacterium]